MIGFFADYKICPQDKLNRNLKNKKGGIVINNDNNFMVICVVGQPGAGKDALAEHFVTKRNFSHISTGDIIREEMRKKNIPTGRESMRNFSQNRRNEIGNFYPANIAAGRIVGSTVISGPRNVAEVEFFKNKFGKNFILVSVNAPIEVRYERIKKGRGREGDNISFDEFKKQEETEYKCNSGTHELNKLLSMADFIIDNGGTLADLYDQANKVILKIAVALVFGGTSKIIYPVK